MHRLLTALICFTSLAVVGCHQVASKNIPTENMEADIKVVVTSNQVASVAASLKLRDELLTFVDLSPGEGIYVESGGERRAMTDVGFTYALSMPVRATNDEMQVSIERTHYASAYDSFVTLPTPFELFVEHQSSRFGSDQIFIEWDQLSDEPMTVSLDGPCMFEYTGHVSAFEDDGLYALSANELHLHSSWDGGTCAVKVTVERTRFGVIDSRLSGGSIEAAQRRQETILIYR